MGRRQETHCQQKAQQCPLHGYSGTCTITLAEQVVGKLVLVGGVQGCMLLHYYEHLQSIVMPHPKPVVKTEVSKVWWIHNQSHRILEEPTVIWSLVPIMQVRGPEKPFKKMCFRFTWHSENVKKTIWRCPRTVRRNGCLYSRNDTIKKTFRNIKLGKTTPYGSIWTYESLISFMGNFSNTTFLSQFLFCVQNTILLWGKIAKRSIPPAHAGRAEATSKLSKPLGVRYERQEIQRFSCHMEKKQEWLYGVEKWQRKTIMTVEKTIKFYTTVISWCKKKKPRMTIDYMAETKTVK